MDERSKQGWLSLSLGEKIMKIFARQVHEFQVMRCAGEFCLGGKKDDFHDHFDEYL